MYNIRFRSIVSYIPPKTSYKSLKLGDLNTQENDVFQIFGITRDCNSELIISLMRQSKMPPGTRLHFLEGLFESHYPWLLEYMELFWDYCKFHKYVYDTSGKCKNIFDYHDCKYYYPFQKKRCFHCEREAIISEIKVSKEQYFNLS